MEWRDDMRPRRVAPILLVALLITGTVSGRRLNAERNKIAERPRTPGSEARANIGAAASARTVAFLQPAIATRAAVPAPAVEATAETTAQVAEIVALQMLAQGTDLELGPRQWTEFAKVTAEIQAIRHAYEASMAVATGRESGRSRIEIPAYAAAGDALRVRFHAGLRENLGEANATEILERLGARLEGHFAGFGVSVQTLELSGAPAELTVTRTIQFWNSVEGQDRLTTRRETHFPYREDPSGEQWSALLAAPPAQGVGQAGG